jgi:hypothetical protein
MVCMFCACSDCSRYHQHTHVSPVPSRRTHTTTAIHPAQPPPQTWAFMMRVAASSAAASWRCESARSCSTRAPWSAARCSVPLASKLPACQNRQREGDGGRNALADLSVEV